MICKSKVMWKLSVYGAFAGNDNRINLIGIKWLNILFEWRKLSIRNHSACVLKVWTYGLPIFSKPQFLTVSAIAGSSDMWWL